MNLRAGEAAELLSSVSEVDISDSFFRTTCTGFRLSASSLGSHWLKAIRGVRGCLSLDNNSSCDRRRRSARLASQGSLLQTALPTAQGLVTSRPTVPAPLTRNPRRSRRRTPGARRGTHRSAARATAGAAAAARAIAGAPAPPGADMLIGSGQPSAACVTMPVSSQGRLRLSPVECSCISAHPVRRGQRSHDGRNKRCSLAPGSPAGSL